jgi:hypothetical protein
MPATQSLPQMTPPTVAAKVMGYAVRPLMNKSRKILMFHCAIFSPGLAKCFLSGVKRWRYFPGLVKAHSAHGGFNQKKETRTFSKARVHFWVVCHVSTEIRF